MLISCYILKIMELNKKLQEIDTLKSELDTLRPLSTKQITNLKRLFDIDFTFNSTALEGNTLTLQETRVVLLDGITIGGKTTREHLEIINHKEAIDYIEKLSKKDIIEYSKSDILNIHSIILKGIDSEYAGKYRDVPVYVRLKDGNIHRFCDPLLINDEMEKYFTWFISKKDIHPLLFAAEAHKRFVSIHPFIDGNGRTARLIMNLVLIHYGFPPAIIKLNQRTQYLDSIESWQQNNSKLEFENILSASVCESLQLYIDTIKNQVIWK